MADGSGACDLMLSFTLVVVVRSIHGLGRHGACVHDTGVEATTPRPLVINQFLVRAC